MTTLLNFFYRLPMDLIAQSFLILSLIYICMYQRFSRCRWLRCGIWTTLTLWVAAVLWITILRRTPGPAHPAELIPFHSYRKLFETGMDEILRTNFMNVVLFYPAGLLAASLLPEGWPQGRKFLSVVIVLALFSLAIECAQFCFSLGEPEVDDLVHNTLGAALGTLPIVFQNIFQKTAG